MSSNAHKIKLIVYINFGILAWATLYIIFVMTRMIIQDRENSNNYFVDGPKFLSTEVKEKIIFIIITWIFVVVYTTVINVILLKGVTQRSHTKCLIWIILAGIGTIGQIYRVIQSLILNDLVEGIYLLIWTLISIYGMYLVKSFMNEIKTDSTLQPLTSKP